MQKFENDNILNEIKTLKDELDFADEKFRNIDLNLKNKAQSLDELLKLPGQNYPGNLDYQNPLNLQEKKRINDNLLQQLKGLHENFFNIQHGVAWFSMQVAAFHALLQQAAFYVASENQVLEARKAREKQLTEKETFRHISENKPQTQTAEGMAEKARTFPFHLNPYGTWPY